MEITNTPPDVLTELSKYSVCCFVVVGVRLSQKTMDLCTVTQFVVELQRPLRLYRQSLDLKALLQFSVVSFAPGSQRRESALCRQR